MLQQWKKLSVTLGAVMCGALLTGVVMSWPQRLNQQARADSRGALSAAAEENLKHAEGLSAAFRNVSDSLRPSVVSISVEATPRMVRGQGSMPPELRRQLPPWLGDDFFRQFEGQQGSPEPRQSGMGSGVVIREDGYLLTNNHVVEGADSVKVLFSDGRKLDAKIVGTDPATDLAVLKVEETGLPAAVLGDSEAVQVGDWVVAIGSPFGLDQTVTAGIISGKNRVQGIVGDGNGFEDFLQTDAAINPGNSGGPLVNLRGEVIGINTAILSRSGASAGIGFAIPMGLAKPVVDSIIESGSVRRGFLGAQVGDINPEVKEKYELKVDSGALISGVLDGQPAAEAGLLPGDVVTEMDGKPVAGGTQLRNYIASRKPGSSVKIKVNRNGSLMDMQVNLRERTDKAMAMFEGGDGESGDLVMGARLQPLTEEQARDLKLQGPAVGLLVTEIEDEGIAAQAQLRVGDVIEEAGGQPLRSVEQFRAILKEQQEAGSGLRMVIRRGNVRMLLIVR
jgi:serine protease Do